MRLICNRLSVSSEIIQCCKFWEWTGQNILDRKYQAAQWISFMHPLGHFKQEESDKLRDDFSEAAQAGFHIYQNSL